jgi:nucleotide-binding universal stress UspA family protein
MASSDTDAVTAATTTRPVILAYDGSELAQLAIEHAGRELDTRRDALVVCVWQPADVGFVPVGDRQLNAQDATDVRRAAEETAAHGASLATEAGFRAQSVAVEAAPTWKGILSVAEEHGASLIVLGAHRRSGIAGHMLGSVTAAVVAHTTSSVLVVHGPA